VTVARGGGGCGARRGRPGGLARMEGGDASGQLGGAWGDGPKMAGAGSGAGEDGAAFGWGEFAPVTRRE